jgi:hypothetical protein
MSAQTRTHLRRRPIDASDAAAIQDFLERRFPSWVPSPIKEILWVKRFGGHLGARIMLFDDVPCLLIVSGDPGHECEDRWIYRGLLPGTDRRPFFFHRMRARWMRSDGSWEETSARHGLNFV